MQFFKPDPTTHFNVIHTTNLSQYATMVLKPGESTGGSTNNHPDSDQWVYIVRGEGFAQIEGKEVPLEEKSLLLIESGESHEITCTGDKPLLTFSIYTPPAY